MVIKQMKMKILFLCISVSLAIVAAASAESPPVMPKIRVESVLQNYGDTLKGEQITHAFVIENRGKADLVIEKAEPD